MSIPLQRASTEKPGAIAPHTTSSSRELKVAEARLPDKTAHKLSKPADGVELLKHLLQPGHTAVIYHAFDWFTFIDPQPIKVANRNGDIFISPFTGSGLIKLELKDGENFHVLGNGSGIYGGRIVFSSISRVKDAKPAEITDELGKLPTIDGKTLY